MATQCRNAKINRNKRMKLYANMILVLLVLIGGVLGFFLAKLTTPPQETITVTKTVEVPAYKSNVLVDTADVFLFDVPLSDSLQRYIYEICADENVPVTLVMAMIEHESGFDPEAVSPTDDYGLMQINAVNHEWLKEEYRCADMMNPYTIVDEANGTGATKWGKLKSGAGWISLDYTKRLVYQHTYKVPKEWLLEFLTSEDYNSITRKSKEHYAMIAAVVPKKRGKKKDDNSAKAQ